MYALNLKLSNKGHIYVHNSQKMPSILVFIINLQNAPHFFLVELLVLRCKGHTKPSTYIWRYSYGNPPPSLSINHI